MISDAIKHVLNNYTFESKNEFKNNDLAHYIRHDLVKEFQNIVNLKVKGSSGQGQWATIPWVAIFDERMTDTAQKGIYIVMLFKEDMSGVYLSLNQGVTYYNNVIRRNKFEINTIAKHFIQNNIFNVSGFNTLPIKIYEFNNQHLNYEDANVISKYYSKEELSEDILVSDIQELTKAYTQFIDGLVKNNYEEFLQDLSTGNLATISTIDSSDQEMFRALQETQGVDISQFVVVRSQPPHFKFPNRDKINSKVIRKKDYLDEHKQNMDIGMLAEERAIDYEIKRLKKLGIKNPESKVKWISKDIGDGIGYDLKSIELVDKKEVEKYIEVKGTKGGITTPFYLSNNEIEFSKKHSHYYSLYRLYNIKPKSAEIYILNGDMSQLVELIPTSFLAYVK